MPDPSLSARLTGCLLGTALGDALGLPAEGMTAAAIQRRFGRVDRFRLLGRTGYVSDDAEQSALVVESLCRGGRDEAAVERHFRRALRSWFLRLPFGLGLATLRACLRMLLGLRRTGVASAGNGAAMRAAPIGVVFADDPRLRRRVSAALAQVTHTDPRAVAGACYVADVAAACTRADLTVREAVGLALGAVEEGEVAAAVRSGIEAAEDGSLDSTCAAIRLGNTGFVLHTVALATFFFLRSHGDPREDLTEVVAAGGDTDSIAAIVGAWLGTRHPGDLPGALVDQLNDGAFGPTHLRALAASLTTGTPPGYSRARAMLRNLAMYPVILAHGFRRLWPG